MLLIWNVCFSDVQCPAKSRWPLSHVSKSKVTRKTSEVLFAHILKAYRFLSTFLMLLILTEVIFSMDFKTGREREVGRERGRWNSYLLHAHRPGWPGHICNYSLLKCTIKYMKLINFIYYIPSNHHSDQDREHFKCPRRFSRAHKYLNST